MNSPNIPMNAYIFIGVASLVLAFVTVLDNQPAESETSSQGQETSFTDYLPSFNGTSDNSATENQAPSEPVAQSQSYDMFNTNMNSDQGLAQNEYQAPPEPVSQPVAQPQSYDMFNTNMNSDQGLAQNEYQAPPEPVSQPVAQPQSYDMFNTNMNSDQGLAQNENIGYQQPYGQQQGQPAQQQQQQPQPVTNPFYGGKNKTGKKIDKKAKKHKKTKSYKGK
jgi:hypothetical protein